MKPLFAFLCCLAATTARAEDVRLFGVEGDKIEVMHAATRYLSAVACPGILVPMEDIHALAPARQGETMPTYATIWTGDLGCFGGTGTWRSHILIATVNNGHAVVRPELSSPVVEFESPARYVTKVVSASADTLVLEGREYGPDDPNSNPSVRVRFTLRADAKGNWKLADKERIAAQ
jgi:hypothetical protein